MVTIEQVRDVPQRDDRLRDLIAELLRTMGLLLVAGGLAAVFWWLMGPPRLSDAVPSLDRVREVLMGSDVPEPVVLAVTAAAGWAVIGYLLFVLVLRLLVLVVLTIFGTTRAARRLVCLIDLVTLPAVRRLTDGALAGVLMTSAWLSPPAKARATVLSSSVALPPPTAPAPELTLVPGWARGDEHVEVGFGPDEYAFGLAPLRVAVPYRVIPGDTLWRIAERFYGDGRRFTEIAAANAGREVAPGVRLASPDMLQPGWELLVPLPAAHLEVDAVGMTYQIQDGDSLWGIAARLLGDGQRWFEIWELNQGHDLGGGRRFTSPSILLPGWTLRLPPTDVVPLPEAGPPSVPAPPPPPALPAPPPSAQQPVVPVLPTPPVIEPSATSPPQDDHGLPWSPSPQVAAVVVAGAAAVGAAAIAVRWRGSATSATAPYPRGAGRNRRGRRPPPRTAGEVERVATAARLVLAAARELGLGELRLLTCQETPDAIALLLVCAPGEEQAVMAARFRIGRRLGCLVDARVVSGQRVELIVTRLRREAAALIAETEADEWPLLIVPLGTDDGTVRYLNLTGVGSVGVGGTTAEVRALLRTWLVTLAASVAAEQYVLAVGAVSGLERIDDDIAVPRWNDAQPGAVDELVPALEAELAARLTGEGAANPTPVILALLQSDTGGDGSRLETLIRRGREAAIHPIVLMGEAVEPRRAGTPGCEVTVTFAVVGVDEDAVPGMLTVRLADAAPVVLRPVTVPTLGQEGSDGTAERPASSMRTPSPAGSAGPADYGVDDAGQFVLSADDTARADPDPDRAVPEQSDEVAALDTGAGLLAASEPEAGAGAIVVEESDERDHAGQARARPAPVAILPRQLLLADDNLDDESSDVGVPRSETATRFHVRCLGGFAVELHGQPITTWRMQKARELLAFLIAQGDTWVPRDVVWEALWPDVDPGSMQPLSDAAYHVRRALREAAGEKIEPLITQGARYRLRLTMFQVDLAVFDTRLRRAAALPPVDALIEYERALGLYQGQVFGLEPFDWADGRRREYQSRFITAAHTAATLALRCRDTERAAGWYRDILHHEPTDEAAARGLMTCYAALGDLTAVRKVYKVLVGALRQEFGDATAEPLPETVTHLRELVGGA